MSKLEFNYDNLNGYANPNLKSSIETLRNAILRTTQTSIPSDFVYRNYLATLSTKFGNHQKQLYDVIGKIDMMNNSLEDALLQLNRETESIEKISIPLNDTSVNSIV